VGNRVKKNSVEHTLVQSSLQNGFQYKIVLAQVNEIVNPQPYQKQEQHRLVL